MDNCSYPKFRITKYTPSGSVWLIFCLYTLSADQRTEQGICPTITHMERGEVETLFLSEEHRNILSEREKEILRLSLIHISEPTRP